MNLLRNIYKMAAGLTLLSIILLGIFPGCSGTFHRPVEKEISRPSSPVKSPYPLGLDNDTLNIPAHYPLSAGNDTAFGQEYVLADRSGSPSGIRADAYESYRIQLYTSKLYGPASKELNIAREVFDQKVWMDYEVPYYKIRVGDFSSRDEAEKYLPTVREAGYESAWVVRVNANIKTLDEPAATELPMTDSAAGAKPGTEPTDDSTLYPGH
jgi:SPOR domain